MRSRSRLPAAAAAAALTMVMTMATSGAASTTPGAGRGRGQPAADIKPRLFGMDSIKSFLGLGGSKKAPADSAAAAADEAGAAEEGEGTAKGWFKVDVNGGGRGAARQLVADPKREWIKVGPSRES